jgi:L-lactate permease
MPADSAAAVRFTVPLPILMKPGYTIWISIVILTCVVIGAVGLKVPGRVPAYLGQSFVNVLPAAISMCSLIAMSNIMNKSGMMSIIAKSLSGMGGMYPARGGYYRHDGRFMTGSAMGSNVMSARCTSKPAAWWA